MKVTGSVLCFSATLFGTLIFSSFGHACEAPAEPVIPNAETTVTAEMVKAQNEVKAYITAAEAYLECIRNPGKHNQMVTRMEEVAEEFNQVVRAFKAKNSKA